MAKKKTATKKTASKRGKACTTKKKVTKKAAAKRGRPSGFTKVRMDQVEKLAKAGWTDVQMADFFGVTGRTWNNWKKREPEFFQSLKDWKAEADHKVERALYERATGFTTTEDRVVGDQVHSLSKQYPPDTTACIFWLKNRRPDEWRDVKDINHRLHEMSDEEVDEALLRELRNMALDPDSMEELEQILVAMKEEGAVH